MKHGIGARTFPIPTIPIPAFLCITGVVIRGAIPVDTTLRTSIPTGTPLKLQFGIGMFGLLVTTISDCSSLVARASSNPPLPVPTNCCTAGAATATRPPKP